MPIEITEVFYPKMRQDWRDWLLRHPDRQEEIWVQRFLKASRIPCINYDELVEECLCFGWIDGVKKKYGEQSNVQRISRRRKKTFLSELNRQRVWRLQSLGLMTEAGLDPIRDQVGSPDDPWTIPAWIEKALRENPAVWRHFMDFSHFYRRLKIGWIIEAGKNRQEEAQRRLNYLIKMTAQNKQYGTIPLS